MGRHVITSIFATFIILAACGEATAGRRGKRNASSRGEFSFQLESQGRILPTYTHRGRTYVEGHFGSQYAIRVHNHSGSRVEAVVTIDGRDAVSGKPGSYRTERGYVIEPYGSVIIEGFRTSWKRVAAFRFTSVGDSYAARMGDATNVGVIGVAVFKEKYYRPRPRPRPPIIPYDSYESQGGSRGSDYPGSRKSKKRSSAKSAPAPSYNNEMADGAHDDGARASRSHRQGLGTQYGADTYSPSHRTTFQRRSRRRPDALMAIRYDDYQGLVQLGVLPRPRPRPHSRYRRKPQPDPFPLSPEPSFAPPPPRHYWE